jgi:hypothetical protein
VSVSSVPPPVHAAFPAWASPTGGDGLVASVAAGCVLCGVALPTQDALVLSVEGLLGERLVAGGAAEAALVPGAPLVAELLTGPEEWRY